MTGRRTRLARLERAAAHRHRQAVPGTSNPPDTAALRELGPSPASVPRHESGRSGDPAPRSTRQLRDVAPPPTTVEARPAHRHAPASSDTPRAGISSPPRTKTASPNRLAAIGLPQIAGGGFEPPTSGL